MAAFSAFFCAFSHEVADDQTVADRAAAKARRERVKPDDARTVEASQVSAVRLSASATLRTSKTDAFDFQLVEARHTLPLRVNTTCGPVKTFEGGDGLTAQQTVALDPA